MTRLKFEIIDPDGRISDDESVDSAEDAKGWVHCPICSADREVESLEDGCCAICETYIAERDDEEALAAPTAEAEKPRERDEATQLAAEEALRMPYERPTPRIDPNIERELASRTLCRRRLMPFIKKFRPKYNAGWVHDDICRRLERFVQQVERGEEPRLLLMMPPRAGKSEIGSRHLPAWILGKHPDWEIIAASHTSSLTMSFSRYVRDLIRDPAYTAIFPNTKLDPASQSVENWNIVGGGGYLAAGVGTGITGRGAHVLLLDDLVKDIEAADSDTIRDNTWEWYASTAYTRLAPGGGVIGIMTWWHDDDWAGRIQQVMSTGEGDKFEIIKYPAINDEGDEYILTLEPGEPITQRTPTDPTPLPEGARLTREVNTAIHPARYTTDAMLRIKRNLHAAGQQRVWNALYQQNPLPDEGITFKKDMFRYYGAPPTRMKCYVYQAWDFAITEGQENDFTVGVTIYQDEFDSLYVIDVRRFKSDDTFIIVDEILDYAKEYAQADGTLPMLGLEDGQIWKAMEAVFDRRCQERKLYPAKEILKPLTDKMVRASPLRGRMQLGKVFFDENAPWFRPLFLELTRFPNVKHDDQVDALAWAVRLTLLRTAPRPIEAPRRGPKEKPWKSRLAGIMRGDTGHMSA